MILFTRNTVVERKMDTVSAIIIRMEDTRQI